MLGGLGANSTAGLIRRIRELGLEVPPGAGKVQLQAILEDHHDEEHGGPPRRHQRQGWQHENRQWVHTQAPLPRSPSSPSRPVPAPCADLRGRLQELGFEIPSNVVERGDLEKLVEEAERQRGHQGGTPVSPTRPRTGHSLKADLPSPWEQAESRSRPGRFYFVNRETGERTWEPWFQQESRSSPGRFYYINVLTGQSIWDPPTRRWREHVQEQLLRRVPSQNADPPPPPPPPIAEEVEAPHPPDSQAPEDLLLAARAEPEPPEPRQQDYRDQAFADGNDLVVDDGAVPVRKNSTASCLSCTHCAAGVQSISVAVPPPSAEEWGELPASEPESPQAPPVFGLELRWRKGPMIGRGSLGRVFKAAELETGRIIAVKEVPINAMDKRDAQFKDSLENEVNIMKSLQHPHIVAYLGHDYLDECLYLYLEHLPGGSITQALNEFGPFAESLMASYSKQVLDGLEYLHSCDPAVIHRDIKGSNILIGDGDTVKLADFGCSKRTDDTLTHTMRGSIPWMAPEVLAHSRYGRGADLWSFGCVVIEMGTANIPWGRFEHHLAALVKIGLSQETPPLPEQVSETCKDFIGQCVRRDPEQRLSATDLLRHAWLALDFPDE